MVHLIDWAADPRAVGSGVFLLKSIAQLVDAMIVAGEARLRKRFCRLSGSRNVERLPITSYL